jgi:NAD(P)-dependent dehydrogenase (short-subunit alcohol dehydrogenase family)
MNLQGKAGIVTGAGRGIGRAVALLLAREGASVVVNDPGFGRGGEATEEKPADAVVAEIEGFQGRAIANYSSVADYASAGRMVTQCVETYGKIDFVVNIAGMLRERMIGYIGSSEGALEHVPPCHQGDARRALRPDREFLV